MTDVPLKDRIIPAGLVCISVFLICIAFLVMPNRSLADEGTSSSGNIGFAIRTGYCGTYWNPKGISPYQLDTYGRNFAHFDLGVFHPLSFLGESFDFVDFPHLRLDTNFGTFDSPGGGTDISAATGGNNSYLHTTIDAVFFQFLATRWRSDRFIALYSYPGQFFSPEGIPGEGASSGFDVIEAESLTHDLEIGLIGTTDGLEHPTLLEVGYHIHLRRLPIALSVEGGATPPQIFVPDFRFDGVYLLTHSDPIPKIWPLFTQFRISFTSGRIITSPGTELYRVFRGGERERVFKLLGFGTRLAFEREIFREVNGGVALELDYHLLSGKYNADDGRLYGINNVEVRWRVTVYMRLNFRHDAYIASWK